LPVAPDEQAQVLARELAADELAVVVDGHLRVEAERVGNRLEQLVQRLGGGRDGHQRRRPERFFFLRGGRGGGPPLPLLRTAAAAGAGWRARCLPPSPSPEGFGCLSAGFPPVSGGGAPGGCATVR